MHFDLTDLRLFIQLAEAGSMTGASKQAHLSVASVSARLKSLEENMQARLIWRNHRGIELTPAGERLLKHARLILGQVDALKLSFQGGEDVTGGHIRLVANTTTVTEILPEILARFLAEHPLVTVDLQERSNRDIVRFVVDGSADVSIVTGPIPLLDIQVLHFSTDKLVAVTPEGHPLARHRSITLRQMADYPFINMYQGSTLATFLHEKMEQSGKQFRARIQLYSFESICRMVEAGVGVGVVPDTAFRRYGKTMKLAVIPLNEPWVLRERCILVRDVELLPACATGLIDAIMQYEPTAATTQ